MVEIVGDAKIFRESDQREAASGITQRHLSYKDYKLLKPVRRNTPKGLCGEKHMKLSDRRWPISDVPLSTLSYLGSKSV